LARELDACTQKTAEVMLIVIGSSPDRQRWLADCSASIKRDHIAVVSFGFELAKIGWVIDNTNADRFLFLQDSWVIKDQAFWDLLDKQPGSVAINSDPYFYGCYAGVYERSVIEEIGVPEITTKREAIDNEIAWHKRYVEVAGEPVVLFPDLTDARATRQVERHGRINLLLENDYLAKYKGTWY
jgi:hypothetical protein